MIAMIVGMEGMRIRRGTDKMTELRLELLQDLSWFQTDL